MNKPLTCLISAALGFSGFLHSCTSNSTPQATAPTSPANGVTGQLQVLANGEDFVRQGFVSKDGWQISFDHVFVTLEGVTAYQTDPPYDPEAKTPLQAKQTVSLSQPQTLDLAAGDEQAAPILVGEVTAPAGHYNALAWKMVPAAAGPAQGSVLMLQGTATKAGQTVDFVVKLDQPLAFSCGEFVGEQRKGFVQAGSTADLEATFHFDHLFGDGSAPATEALNQDALGFQPLAALAENGKLKVDQAILKQKLSSEEYQKLIGILPSLGHVGEGHCEETLVVAQKSSS